MSTSVRGSVDRYTLPSPGVTTTLRRVGTPKYLPLASPTASMCISRTTPPHGKGSAPQEGNVLTKPVSTALITMTASITVNALRVRSRIALTAILYIPTENNVWSEVT